MDWRAITILLILPVLAGCSARPAETASDSRLEPATDLQRAAERGLGDTEGAVIVIDPSSGRIRALVNPRLAFEQSFPPGSAIKPFTLLAAWRAGLANPETAHRCGTRYDREGFSIVCSHPRSAAQYTIDQGLAWSCNDFFAGLGERLSEGSFNGLLSEFGFGRRTGIPAAENPGQLRTGAWNVRNTLGEGDALLVTPVQLITAYAALLNGGRRFRPASGSEGVITQRISIPREYREMLVKGMRGAVTYGTASKSGLDKFQVIGKTGTSTSSNGFRSHGWFIGFEMNGETAGLGVLVFTRRGNGAGAAAVAGRFFECLAGDCGEDSTRSLDASFVPRSMVRVRSISEGVTRELPLEDYLIGVLSGEAGAEKSLEALKAQAVVSRTFALKNAGRHGSDGYDYCSTTHCQRFVAGARKGLARKAVASTAGMILADRQGRPIDAYFHAACGGRTADIESLWGVRPGPAYLRGVRDDFCAEMPHHNWTRTIDAEKLRRALQMDERSRVGSRIASIRVARRDAGGRAELVIVQGERRVELSGWEFKMIVGRHLGWQTILSSFFEVRREGDSFVFTGKGFGHGLGLCQEGARGAARAGLGFDRILMHYFPGARIVSADRISSAGIETDLVRVGHLQSPPADSFSSDHFRLRVARGGLNRSPEGVLRTLEGSMRDIRSRLEQAGIPFPLRRPIEIVIHATTADFISATGLSGWSAGAARGDSIHLQPLDILRKRRIFETTLRHELAHVVIEEIGRGRAPRWLAEGLAIHFAGEAATLPGLGAAAKLSRAGIEEALKTPKPYREMRVLYARAYREVRNLILQSGESQVWRLAAGYRETGNDQRRL